MSQFVNYNKRSVTLPKGCKNLSDLLQPRSPSKVYTSAASREKPVVTRGESGSIALSEIRKLIALPFQSQARASILMLSLPDEQLTFDFTRIPGEPMNVSVMCVKDIERDRLMKAFLLGHGLQQPDHARNSAPPIPDVPIQFIYPISPPPADPVSATKFTAEFFRDVCGLNEDSLLLFRHWRIPAVG